MNLFFTFFCFFVLQLVVFCQPPAIKIDPASNYSAYYNTIIKADSLFLAGHQISANTLYNKAFTLVNRPFKHDYLSAFENASAINTEQALLYLKKGCELGLTKKQLKSNTYFEELNSRSQKEIYKTIQNTTIQKNDSLSAVLKKMVKKDQKARVFWTNWLKWEKQVEIMDKADRPNALQLLDICETMKFPGFSLIGENTDTKYRVEDAALMILHFTKTEYNALLPHLIKAVEMGELYPYHLARCTDYLYMGTESDSADYRVLDIQQIYGTMYSGNEIIPFGSIDRVNKARASIGLEPIEQYAEKRNLSLPTVEKIHYISKK